MKNVLSVLVQLFFWLFPMPIKIFAYKIIFGYKIQENCRIGMSIILVNELVMYRGSRIGNFNLIKRIDRVVLNEEAGIGTLNVITGFSLKNFIHFQGISRKPELLMGKHSSITTRHYIDCNDCISIGEYTTVAGIRSTLLSHTIDVTSARQSTAPITIGSYCFLGTGVIILPGSSLPNYSVLGAGSLLNTSYSHEYTLYAGVPARELKKMASESYYFSRHKGYVD